jgi:hypothetical protein
MEQNRILACLQNPPLYCIQASWIQSTLPYPISLCTPKSHKWSLHFKCSDQNFVHISHLLMRATRATHPILLDLMILQIKNLLIMFHISFGAHSASCQMVSRSLSQEVKGV